DLAGASGIKTHNVPAILRLEDGPLPDRRSQQRVAERLAESGRKARDRTRQNGTGLLLKLAGFALRLNLREVSSSGRFIRWRRKVESHRLGLVETFVVLRKPFAQLLFSRARDLNLAENEHLELERNAVADRDVATIDPERLAFAIENLARDPSV